MERLKLWIDGEWVASESGQVREIRNPADGTVLTQAYEAGEIDVDRAVSAARKAFDSGIWSSMPAYERAAVLDRFANAMEADVQNLARMETQNTGKPYIESEYDVYDSVAVIRYYAGMITKPSGQTYAVSNPDIHAMTVREPIGVCGLIVAWNFPISLAVWKLAPALAAGNTVVLKPSEFTPLSAVRMCELLSECGIPAGVVNLVLGGGAVAGDRLVASKEVDKIAFTGGIQTGRKIMASAAQTMKSVTLELGGKSPNLMFADADFKTAVDYGLFGMFYNQGEVCSAGSRILVEDTIYDAYLEAFVEGVKKIKIGNGMEQDVRMGPLISRAHMEKVLGYIQTGKQEGATLVCGGYRFTEPPLQNGYYVAPAVFTDTTPDMHIVREEIFGPVVVFQKFHGEEEAIALANDTDYGLAAGVFTGDSAKALRVVRSLRAGITWVNTYGPVYPEAPWGGYKQSGIGRELGTSGLDDFTEVKQININMNVAPTGWFD